jgi:hypothetical protein
MGRRAALGRLAAVVVGAGTVGCTRASILRAMYPEVGRLEADDVRRILTAFVTTVVPESTEPERVERLFEDPSLPMAEFHQVLAADLARRTRARTGHDHFDRLTPQERTAVVADGLAAGGTASRLYNGGVLFTQVMVYAGLCSDDGSCSLIDFEGQFRFRGYAAQTYPDPEHFLARAVTPDGNPW